MNRRQAVLALSSIMGFNTPNRATFNLPKESPAAPESKMRDWMVGAKLGVIQAGKCEISSDHELTIRFVTKSTDPRSLWGMMFFRIREHIPQDATPLEVAEHLRRLANSIEKF